MPDAGESGAIRQAAVVVFHDCGGPDRDGDGASAATLWKTPSGSGEKPREPVEQSIAQQY
jgi:hypothetical protein